MELLPNGEASIYDRWGRLVPHLPAPPLVPESPVDALRGRNVEAGVSIGEEGKPKWGYEPMRLGYILEVLLQNAMTRRAAARRHLIRI